MRVMASARAELQQIEDAFEHHAALGEIDVVDDATA
jgi:hypothetical protein